MIDLRGKNVLITGGLGFIGSNLAHECVRHGANVTIYDCLDPKSGGNMQNLFGIEEDVKIVFNDIRNLDGLCSCIRKKDIVFHCAAYTSHINSMLEPIIDIKVNCMGTINVLESARRLNRDAKIIHVGTSTQIGKMIDNPIDEFHSEFPVDIYSANKSVTEKYVLIYGSSYEMRTCVMRLSNTYGQRSNIKSANFGFMNFFIGLALKNKELTIFGNGEQIRNVNYVDDVVDMLIKSSLTESSNGKVYFAVGDNHMSMKEISEGIVSNIGGSIRYIPWPKDREKIEVGDCVIDNSKMKGDISLNKTTSYCDGLQKTKDYFSSCVKYYL